MSGLRGTSPLLLAGAAPGAAAGNRVSSEVLYQALSRIGTTATLTHVISPVPFLRSEAADGVEALSLGSQPLLVHGEAFVGGVVHRSRLRRYRRAWVVNSRYASALVAARVPYVIWEATTFGEELRSTSWRAARQARLGSGLGVLSHRLLLPVDERLERAAYRNAKAVFAMSEYTREAIMSTHPRAAAHLHVLRHPPTPSFLSALDRARAQPRTNPAASGAASPRVLFVGRVDDPRKNFPLLLRAFGQLRTRHPHAALTVIGPFTEAWRKGIASDTNSGVTFAGLVDTDALVCAYLSHDLLVLSSRQEGFGIVVAEALHTGLPVVSTRCGGPEEVIRSSGGGILVDHDAGQLADAIARLVTDDVSRRAMGERARQWATRELSFETFAGRVREITEEFLADSPR